MFDPRMMEFLGKPRKAGEGVHAIAEALVKRGVDREKGQNKRIAQALTGNDLGFYDMAEEAISQAETQPSIGFYDMIEEAISDAEGQPYDRKGPIAPAPIDPNFDGREMLKESSLQPQGSFQPGAEFQTADLDAFKMMQLQPEYEDPAANDANSSESRRLQLLRRAMFADAALEDPRLAKAMTRLDNNVAGRFGALGRLYTDDDYELGRLMAEQFSSAVLRGDSGAATPDPEVARYMRQYFPLPNETDEQLAAKKAMRREEIRAMIQSLPDDARGVAEQIQREIEDLKRQADVPEFDPSAPMAENPYIGISEKDFGNIDLESLTPVQLDQLYEARGL